MVVHAPDGRIAGYADGLYRILVAVSIYGYVHPDYRGRGVGTFLVAWGERWARDHMSQAPRNTRAVVQHYVNADNKGARQLLESAG